jgi:hypothetical protein
MMENSFSKELIILIKKRISEYGRWLKPDPRDPLALSIIKSIFKGITTLVLIAFSPVVILILIISFLAAF